MECERSGANTGRGVANRGRLCEYREGKRMRIAVFVKKTPIKIFLSPATRHIVTRISSGIRYTYEVGFQRDNGNGEDPKP